MDKGKDLGGYLTGITYGKHPRHIFCAIYGPNGAGKTTWASQAPEPVYIDLESGSQQLEVARLPQPKDLIDFRNLIRGLTNQEHPFKTLVIDPLDFLELLIWRQVCSEDPNKPKSIEQALGGYGKGFTRAYEIWRGLLWEIGLLNNKMHVILIGNSKIKRFDDPSQSVAYDRYELALNTLAAAAVRQAVDAVLFATFVEKVRELSKHTGKAIGDGSRIVYTEHRPGFDAKNRFRLPFELALEWRAFAERVRKFYSGSEGEKPKVPEIAETEAKQSAEVTTNEPIRGVGDIKEEICS